jgi:hypothetical protein
VRVGNRHSICFFVQAFCVRFASVKGLRSVCSIQQRAVRSSRLATADDYEPFKQGGGAVGDAAAQWRNILTNIKSDLEELGTSLEHLIRLTFFVKGPFPTGGVLSSPNFRQDVMALGRRYIGEWTAR